MKKFIILTSIATSAMLCVSSCAGIQHLAVTNSVNLESGNFRILRTVKGEANATYVFGIGGMSESARETNAMEEMRKNAKLGPNQAIAYVSLHESKSCILGIVIHKCTTVTGTVVEFIDGEQSVLPYQDEYAGESMPIEATPVEGAQETIVQEEPEALPQTPFEKRQYAGRLLWELEKLIKKEESEKQELSEKLDDIKVYLPAFDSCSVVTKKNFQQRIDKCEEAINKLI